MTFQETGLSYDEGVTGLSGGGKKQNKEFRKRYNRWNPPPTLDAAEQRLEVLEEEIASIEEQLEFANMPRLSDYEYEQWRLRSTKALSFKRVEHGFVERWISAFQSVHDEGLEVAIEGNTHFANAILVVKATADSVKEAYGSSLTGQRGKAHKPDDPVCSKERLKQLTHWQTALEKSLREMRIWMKLYKIRPETAALFKKPALEILRVIHVEMLEIQASLSRTEIRAKPI